MVGELHFSITGKPFIWRFSTWQYFDQYTLVNWNVTAESDDQIFLEMPAEILAEHPALSPSKMVYKSTTVYTESVAFGEYIDYTFASEQDPRGIRVGLKLNN